MSHITPHAQTNGVIMKVTLIPAALFLFTTAALADPAPVESAPATAQACPHYSPTLGKPWLASCRDSWSTKDKRDHFTLSALTGVVVDLGLPTQSPWIKFGACMTPWTLKEVYDATHGPGGTASYRDMIANAAGCGVGIFVVGKGITFLLDKTSMVIGYKTEF